MSTHDLRTGGPGDADLLGRMLAEFNAEYGESEPAAGRLSAASRLPQYLTRAMLAHAMAVLVRVTGHRRSRRSR